MICILMIDIIASGKSTIIYLDLKYKIDLKDPIFGICLQVYLK